MTILIFIFSIIIFFKLFIILIAYALLKDFQKYIDKKFLVLLKIIAHKQISKKLTKFSNPIYGFSVNALATSIVIGFQNINSNPMFANTIFFISLLMFIFSLSLKMDEDIEKFNQNYLDDILLAIIVGCLFGVIDDLRKFLYNQVELNEFNIIFLILFAFAAGINFKNDPQKLN
ncbi:MAG: hypothetical protein KU37_02940 [Sulfuricurvum sp. PC08-66]|nr:MAG: hypothetical protein KU37_02940 [Sulfuricurvum sp. PC08-66]